MFFQFCAMNRALGLQAMVAIVSIKNTLDGIAVWLQKPGKRIAWALAGDQSRRSGRLRCALRNGSENPSEEDWIRIAELGWDEGALALQEMRGAFPSGEAILLAAIGQNRVEAISWCLERIEAEDGSDGLIRQMERALSAMSGSISEPEEQCLACLGDLVVERLVGKGEEVRWPLAERAAKSAPMESVFSFIRWIANSGERMGAVHFCETALESRSSAEGVLILREMASWLEPRERALFSIEMLRSACEKGFEHAVNPLFALGADPFKEAEPGRDFFLLAARKGSLGALSMMLLEHPERLHMDGKGADLLLEAILGEHGESVSWLIGRGGIFVHGSLDERILPTLAEKGVRLEREGGEPRWIKDAKEWIKAYAN